MGWGGGKPEQPTGLSLLLTDDQWAAINAERVIVEVWSDGTFAAFHPESTMVAHGPTPRLAIEALTT